MLVKQTLSFKKAVKKLHTNQKKELDKAIKIIIKNPMIGEQKKGNLSQVRVHKFKMIKQLILLAYKFEEKELILTLLALGAHENFYRDIKNIL